MTNELHNPAIGSSLEDFLKEEGIYEECRTKAVKEVLAWQIQQLMQEKGLSKAEMAQQMQTSRAALDRLLDPDNTAVTLRTMMKAAAAVGKSIRLELV
jgi:predicted XRE-type DNA-binding protein